jgi:transcription initiation factor TFIIH subunit 2
VGLSAQVAICAELCTRTNGGDPSSYAVALHEQHFRELFLAATTPPVTHAAPADQPGTGPSNHAALLMMGFPSRALASKDHVSLCACHHRPTREGYACTRCRAKVCRLPAECPVCGLTLVLSTHLARSYHHLFPLRGWVEVSWAEAARSRSSACFACLAPFPPVPSAKGKLAGKGKGERGGGGGGGEGEGGIGSGSGSGNRSGGVVGLAASAAMPEVKAVGVSESGRYACQVCGNHFCIDCDVYAHEVIHNCPGCQSDTRGTTADGAVGDGEEVTNGHGPGEQNGANEAMVIDS